MNQMRIRDLIDFGGLPSFVRFLLQGTGRHSMSIRVRIDFSLYFSIRLFTTGFVQKAKKGKHLDLEILCTLYVFLMFIRLSLFWVLTRLLHTT